ncbi:hypothetical protein NUACC21_34170 [Scytonema sp. NUACC21]
MAGVEGRTGNPRVKNPKKKNETSFAVKPGREPKGRMMGFRPSVSLEQQIEAALIASGKTLSQWLQEAAISYLEKS